MSTPRRWLELSIFVVALALGLVAWKSGQRPANFLLGSWQVEAHGRHYTVVFDDKGRATAEAPEMSQPVQVRYQADFSGSPAALDVWAEDEPIPYRMLCELTGRGELRVQECLPDRARPTGFNEKALILKRSH